MLVKGLDFIAAFMRLSGRVNSRVGLARGQAEKSSNEGGLPSFFFWLEPFGMVSPNVECSRTLTAIGDFFYYDPWDLNATKRKVGDGWVSTSSATQIYR
jgi:hypothetical protein